MDRLICQINSYEYKGRFECDIELKKNNKYASYKQVSRKLIRFPYKGLLRCWIKLLWGGDGQI